MYDAREKAIRDRQWELNASRQEGLVEGETKGRLEGRMEGRREGRVEGKIEGEIKLFRMLEEILQLPVSSESALAGKTLEELQQQTAQLQDQVRSRRST